MQRFQKNLAFLRSIAPVETIAMEGAPFSRFDNRLLWGKSREYGVGSREIPPSSGEGSGKKQSAGEGIKDGSLFSRREGLRRTREEKVRDEKREVRDEKMRDEKVRDERREVRDER